MWRNVQKQIQLLGAQIHMDATAANADCEVHKVHRGSIWGECPIKTFILFWNSCQRCRSVVWSCTCQMPNTSSMKQQCGTRLLADAINWCDRWPSEWEDKEGLVILADIFAHEMSFGYSRPNWRRVLVRFAAKQTPLTRQTWSLL